MDTEALGSQQAMTAQMSFYLLDRQGGGREIDRAAANAWTPEQGILWLQLNYEHADAPELLMQLEGLPPLAANALQIDETRPRSDPLANGLLVVLRGVNTNPGASPDDMVAIRIWLESDRIITSHRRPLQSIQAIKHAITHGEGPRSTSDYLVSLTEQLGHRINEAVENIAAFVDDTEEQLASGTFKTHELRRGLGELRLQSARMRRYLAPQRDALERLYRESGHVLEEKGRLELREEADRFRRYVEDLDLIRERAMVSLEQLQALLAEEQNSRIYLLSIVAAIFLPLSFVTGLLGMNVGGIPGVDNPAAFKLLLVTMLVISAALLALLRWRKWL